MLIVSADKDLMQLIEPGRRHVRSRLGRPRRAAHRRAGSVRLFRGRAGQGGRRPGPRGRLDRQRTRRAGHRGQDRRAAHRRVRRPRNPARPREPDQAAEAARGADAARERPADPHLETAGDPGAGRGARDAARISLATPTLDGQRARGFLQGDGADHDHPPRGRDVRLSTRPRSSRTRASSAPAGWQGEAGEAALAREQDAAATRTAAPAAATAADATAIATPADLARARAVEAKAPVDRAADTPRSRPSTSCPPSSPSPTRPGSSPSTSRRRRPTRCRRSWSACRWPSPREGLLSAVRPSHRPGRPFRGRRALAAGQMREEDADRGPEAADGGAGASQDRPRHEVRGSGSGPARRHRRAGRRHDADLLRARRRIDGGFARPRRSLPAIPRPQADRRSPTSPGAGRNAVGLARAPVEKAAEYAAEKADLILRLWRALRPRLVAERVSTVYETLERPLISVLARMERRGVAIDRGMLSRLAGDFSQTMARLEDEISRIVGGPFNPGSPKQLGDILFGQMGLPGGKKTATGAWSTTASVLEDLAAEGHELPGRVLEWRQVSKLKSTYADSLPGYLDADGARAHVLRARLDHHGAAVVVRTELAEHPGPDRGGPEDPPGLRRAEGAQADLRRLQPDRAAPSRPHRRHSGLEEGLFGRARHPRDDRVRDVRHANRRDARAKFAAAPRRSTSASSTASPPSASPTSSAFRARRRAPTSGNTSSASPESGTTWRRPRRRRAPTAT